MKSDIKLAPMLFLFAAMLTAPLAASSYRTSAPSGTPPGSTGSYQNAGSYTNGSPSGVHQTVAIFYTYYNTSYNPGFSPPQFYGPIATGSSYSLKSGDSVNLYSGSGPIPQWNFFNGAWQVAYNNQGTTYSESAQVTSSWSNSAPSSSISADKTEIFTNQTATITFSASDTNGNLATWCFYRTDRSPNPSGASGSSAGPGSYGFSSPTAGTWTFAVFATDDDGASSGNSSVTITVKDPPTVTWTLSGSVSPAGAGNISGLGSYNDQTTATPGASANSGWQFSSWGGAASGTSTSASVLMNANKSVTAIFVPIPKSDQTVNISPTSKTITVGDSVSFTSSGGAGTGAWSWSGATGSGTSASQTFNSVGTFTVSVSKAGDSNYNASNTASSTITVNAAPVVKSDQTVSISPTSKTITVGDPVSFSASGGAGTGAWSWSGATGSGSSGSQTFNSVGTFTVSVSKAGDSNYNASNTASSTITVNAAPVGRSDQTVSISPTSKTIITGDTVSFTASGGGGTGAWSWSGATGSGTSASQTFTSAGDFIVSVSKAGDSNYNASNTATASIAVRIGSLSADITAPASVTRPTSGRVTVQVTLTGYSPSSQLTNYYWSATDSTGSVLNAEGWLGFQTTERYVNDGYYEQILVSAAWTEQVWVFEYTTWKFQEFPLDDPHSLWVQQDNGGWKWGHGVAVDVGHYSPVYHPAVYRDGEWRDTSYFATSTVPVKNGTVTTTFPVSTATALGAVTINLRVQDSAGRTATTTRVVSIVQQPSNYTLTVNTTGTGTVTGAGTYPAGNTATLTATAGTGWKLSGFIGAVTSSTSPASLLMDADKTVTAVFVPQTYTLTTSVSGAGTVTSGGTYNAPNPTPTAVTIVATPSTNSRYTGFTGTTQGTVATSNADGSASLYVPMTIDRSIIANFVSKLPQSITFAPIGNHSLTEQSVPLTATASSGLPVTFSVVSGPGLISGSRLSFTGSGAITVQADQPGDLTYSPAPPVQQSTLIVSQPTTTLRENENAVHLNNGESEEGNFGKKQP